MNDMAADGTAKTSISQTLVLFILPASILGILALAMFFDFLGTQATEIAKLINEVEISCKSGLLSSLGFMQPVDPAVTVTSTSVDLGAIRLVSVALQLEKVAVTEKRQDVQLAPDRNTYVVRDMPTAKGGNALDVLRTVPAVDVDIDNVVSLRGNSGVNRGRCVPA